MSTGVIWVRVSSDEQTHGYSPDAQLHELENAAKIKGIEVVKIFNVSESAKTPARRQFKALIEFIEAEKPEVLITYALDRLTRNPDDLHVLHRFIERGLRIYIVNQGRIVDKKSTPTDRFNFLLHGDMAYLDNLQRGERTKMGMTEKANRGGLPSRAPIGYENVPDPSDPLGRRRAVVIDALRGPLIKLAYELYAKGGYSLMTLRDELNRRGLRQKPTSKHPNSPVSVHGLEVILKNPFYFGEMRWDKQLFKGAHEPLISTELFNEVQKRLKANLTYSKPAVKKAFVFKTFLKCGYCHSCITAEEQTGGHSSGHYIYYKCTRAKNRNCPQRRFTEAEIDAKFAEAIGQLYIDKPIAEKIKMKLKEFHVKRETTDKAELKRLQAEYTRKTNYLRLIYNDRLDETITKEDYLERKITFEQDLRTIRGDIEKLGRVNGKYREEGIAIIDLLRGFKKTYQTADNKGKVAILSATVDRAVLRGGDLHVFWKEPFDTLFILGEKVRTGEGWGE